MTMILRLSALLCADGMGIVESHQAFTAGPVQRERIVQAMRLFGYDGNLRYHKPDPIPRFGINDERQPVEVKQRVECGIVRPHPFMLSVHDNLCKMFPSLKAPWVEKIPSRRQIANIEHLAVTSGLCRASDGEVLQSREVA